MEDKILKAVFDTDIETLLKSINLWDEFEKGLLKCISCNKIITKDNLGCIIPFEGKIHLSCDNTECLKVYLYKIRKD